MSNPLDKAELEMKYFGTRYSNDMSLAWMENCSNPLPSEQLKQSFPYYAPDPPAPIPTPEEIEKQRPTENNLTTWRGDNCTKVYRVNGVFAVKICCSPDILREAENLLYLAEHSRVRVPKVYAAFSHQGADPEGFLESNEDDRIKDRSDLPTYSYLVMNYIPGKDLNEANWIALSYKAKVNACCAVAEQLRLLRSVPCSPPYYGRINHQCWAPEFNPLILANTGPHGPYESYADFEKALYTHCVKNCIIQSGEGSRWRAAMRLYLSTYHDTMAHARDTEPKLTHMDLHLSNVRFAPKENDAEDFDVTIIDWADLSWMPAYLQAARVLCTGYDGHAVGQTWDALSRGFDPFPHDTALYMKEFLRSTSPFTLGLGLMK